MECLLASMSNMNPPPLMGNDNTGAFTSTSLKSLLLPVTPMKFDVFLREVMRRWSNLCEGPNMFSVVAR